MKHRVQQLLDGVQAPAVRIESGSSVTGSGPIEGFVLDLNEVWSCQE